MIHSVRSDRDTFRTSEFEPGFNVVLAERTVEASERDSRNGAGKTSLIEVIHFCLGSDYKRSELAYSELAGWNFSVDLDLRGERVDVSRDTADPGRVLPDRILPGWPVEPARDVDTATTYYSLERWKTLLGWAMFDIAPELAEEAAVPTARTLLPYFARRGRDAFSDPFTHFRSQRAVNRQVANSFLLGLDWRYPRTAAELKRREGALRDGRKAIEAWRRQGERGGGDGTEDLEGHLEAVRINLERRLRQSSEQLATFKVHPQYQELETRASDSTREIHVLTNKNVSDRELLAFYRDSLEAEEPADPAALEAMYAEAELYFPEQVTARLREVRTFHDEIYESRRNYLDGEIRRIERRIEQRDSEVKDLSDARARVLGVLSEHGAFSEYTQLEQRRSEIAQELATVTAQLDELRGFDEELSRLRIEREENAQSARNDFNERREAWSRAVDVFGANTAELYESAGELAISPSDSGGLTLDVNIERGASQGVQEMMVFCYDLTLAELWAERGVSPGFLIHDSTIFDGVDERQVARGLELAHRKAEQCGFQYICCLNSDRVPWDELSDDFELRDYVRLELSDREQTGGLFGIRF